MNVPRSYEEWMACLTYLSQNPVSDEFISKLKQGTCPGIEQVMPQFLERIQDTVNQMVRRCTRNCTKRLNEALEEGDFSNLEAVFYRSCKEMKRCRFFLHICFIPNTFVQKLDECTVSEMHRYFAWIKKSLEELADDSGNSDMYDVLYYLNRLINKDRHNGKL